MDLQVKANKEEGYSNYQSLPWRSTKFQSGNYVLTNSSFKGIKGCLSTLLEPLRTTLRCPDSVGFAFFCGTDGGKGGGW